MWRLMYAMIVVSDSGSVAVDSHATNWPSQQVCEEMIRTLYSTPETSVIGGHKLTIKTNAQCVPVNGGDGEPLVSIGPGGLRFGGPLPPAPPPHPSYRYR